MIRKPLLIAIAVLSVVAGAHGPLKAGAAAVPAADAVVAAAVKKAAAEGKVVLIEFGASWCTWCRSFEAFVHAPTVSPIIDRNYVVANLTVKESDDKKALENPGAQAAMDRWGGAKTGLPFYVFLNAAGRKIADSNAMPGGSNIGFPATQRELDVFVGVMEKTAPRLTPAGRAAIVDYLKKGLRP